MLVVLLLLLESQMNVLFDENSPFLRTICYRLKSIICVNTSQLFASIDATKIT